jgi:hypothetical protein
MGKSMYPTKRLEEKLVAEIRYGRFLPEVVRNSTLQPY